MATADGNGRRNGSRGRRRPAAEHPRCYLQTCKAGRIPLQHIDQDRRKKENIMHQEDRAVGVAAPTEALDAAVGRTDMWGDRVVGSTEKELTTVEEQTLREVHIQDDIFLHTDCKIYRHHEDGNQEVLKIVNGYVYPIKGKRGINLALTVATYFLPNPLNLPFVRKMDGTRYNCHVTNLRWSSMQKKSEFTKKAREAERNKRMAMDVFQPYIEIPETITLKSRV